MDYCKSPADVLKKKALGLLEKIEGHPKSFQLRDFSGDLRLKRKLHNKSFEFQTLKPAKETFTPRLPNIGNKKLTESFKSQNDGSFVFKNKAGVLVIPKLQIDKSTEYKDIFQHILEDKQLKNKVKSLKSRFKEITNNITPTISRKLKKKIKFPSVADKKLLPYYDNSSLSPNQSSLLQKYGEKLGFY